MTGKTKYILFGIIGFGVLMVGGVVLIAVLAVGIGLMSAETGEAKGTDKPAVTNNKLYKQADIDGLIKFHEWAAQKKFTADERQKFESFIARDFERDASKARKNTDELLKTFKEIQEAKKDVQETTRQLLVPAMIKDFRKRNDDYARFMLKVYDQNAGDDDSDASNRNPDDSDATAEKDVPTSNGSDSAGLVGEWFRSEGSSQIDATGKTQYGGGGHFNYRFSADGTVEYSMDEKIKTVMQCDIVRKKSRKGKYSVDGDTITVEFGEESFFSSNSCDDKDNFDKKLPAETVTLKWSMKTEYEVTHLILQDADGEFPYDKK